MKRLVVLMIVVGLVVAAAVAATFGSAAPSQGASQQAKLPPKPKLPALPAAVKARGKWQIGVKCDTPPFGWQDTSGRNRGYDVEVARQFAKWAFGSTSKVDFTCVTTASRIGTLTSGRVDIIISTLTWTADREKVIDYSVPYYNAAGRLLVQEQRHRRQARDLDARARSSCPRQARSTTVGSRTASRTRRSRSCRARQPACSR